MSGVVNTVKGAFSSAGNVLGGQTNVAPVDLNRRFATPYSSLQGGVLTLDPTIRPLQDEGLASIRRMLGDVGTLRSQAGTRMQNILNARRLSSAGLGGVLAQPGPATTRLESLVSTAAPGSARLRGVLDQAAPTTDRLTSALATARPTTSRLQQILGVDMPTTDPLQRLQAQREATLTDLIGNREDFINARLDPLRRTLAQREGQLQRELGRTGVRGSFANQAMTNLGIEGAQALREAEAQALDQALAQERTAAGELFAGEGAILGAEQGLRGQRTAEEQALLDREQALRGQLTGEEQALLGAEQGLRGQRAAEEQALFGEERAQRGQQLAEEQALLSSQAALRGQQVDEQTRLFEIDNAIRSGEISAEQGLTAMLSGLIGQETNLAAAINDIGAGRFNQELQSLGLSVDSIRGLIAAAQGAQAAKDAAEGRAVGTLGRIASGVGGFLTGGAF